MHRCPNAGISASSPALTVGIDAIARIARYRCIITHLIAPRHPPSAARHPPSAARHHLPQPATSATRLPPLALRHPPSATCSPPRALRHLLSATRLLPPAFCQPPSASRASDPSRAGVCSAARPSCGAGGRGALSGRVDSMGVRDAPAERSATTAVTGRTPRRQHLTGDGHLPHRAGLPVSGRLPAVAAPSPAASRISGRRHRISVDSARRRRKIAAGRPTRA
jgi:hypothetical protein